MNAHKIAVKLYATHLPPLASFIPIFHQWIRDKVIPDHLLIDVADYAHVENGPGIVLVSSEANIFIDENGGRPGLLYVRKTPAAGTFTDRLHAAVAATMLIAERLENEAAFADQLKFDTHELQVRLNDRLLTPNNEQTLAATAPAFESLTRSLYPNQPVEVRSVGKERELFTIRIVAPSAPLLQEIRGAASPASA